MSARKTHEVVLVSGSGRKWTVPIKSARARSTGTLVEVWRAADLGVSDPGGEWVTVCEHGTSIHHETRALAMYHSAAPEEWCDQGCRLAYTQRHSGHDPARDRWLKDFEAVRVQIPAEWLVHDGDFTGISPEHTGKPLAVLHAKLTEVGYAKGWL